MAMLMNKEKNTILVPNLIIATKIFSRMKGLLGTNSLPEGNGLWIHRCNSIHTFFMQYPIDCVFLDKKMRVVSMVQSIAPWRMTWPIWNAGSVVELSAGEISKLKINIGDELYVGN